MQFKPVRFNNNKQSDFITTVKERVDLYFKSNKLSRFGNGKMIRKTIFMLSLYFVPFGFMLTGVFTNPFALLCLWILMSLGMAGIGLGIMHDANHGAYSRSAKVNNFFGMIINILGANHINWKVQHNVLHHTFTNIHEYDDSLHAGKLLRFSPNQQRLEHHRFQHYYAWFLYSLQTIVWALVTDFVRLDRYYKMGLLKNQNKSRSRMFTELLLWKVSYFAIILGIPLMVLSTPWWWTVLFFITMHLVAGLILSCIFQPAHVMPTSDYLVPSEEGFVENSWAVNQMYTSCNFATGSRWFSWYVGGLNFQIEHHLFPNICHVHYREVAQIVEQTANEFNLPYINHPTFFKAIAEHGRMLRTLGQQD